MSIAADFSIAVVPWKGLFVARREAEAYAIGDNVRHSRCLS